MPDKDTVEVVCGTLLAALKVFHLWISVRNRKRLQSIEKQVNNTPPPRSR